MIEIKNNYLLINSKVIYKSDTEILQTLYLEDKELVVLLLKPSETKKIDLNIIGVDLSGKMRWIIEKVAHLYDYGYYDNIKLTSEGIFFAYNSDSFVYIVDANDGKIIGKKFLK